jgi:hypothetical protein
MALSKAEQAELDALRAEKESLNKPLATSGLSPEEQAELDALKMERDSALSQPMLANKKLEASEATKFRAATEGLAESGTFGYAPQIRAAIRPVTSWLYEKATGEDLPEKSYVQARDEDIKKRQMYAEAAPSEFLGGQVVGTIGTAMAPGAIIGRLGKGAQAAQALSKLDKLGKIGKAAASGAATGLVYNPGDTEGEIDLLQAEDRGKQALVGGATGAVTQGLLSAGGKAVKAFSNKGKGLEKASDMMAVQAAGAKTGEIRKLYDKNSIQRIGKFLKEHSLVGPGKTPEDTLNAVNQMLDSDGKAISEIYAKVGSKAMSPKALAQEMDDVFTKQLKGKASGRKALRVVQEELENLKDLGDNATLEDVLNFRRGIDDIINYDKSVSDMPAAQKALKKVRDFIKERLESEIKSASPQDLEKLKVLNNRYWNASDIETIAKREMARENSKMILGLPELIVGGSYGAADYARNPDDALASLGKGVALGAAMKGARKYGPGLMVRGSDLAAKGLKAIPGGNTAGLLADKMGEINPLAVGYGSAMLSKKPNLKEKRK